MGMAFRVRFNEPDAVSMDLAAIAQVGGEGMTHSAWAAGEQCEYVVCGYGTGNILVCLGTCLWRDNSDPPFIFFLPLGQGAGTTR